MHCACMTMQGEKHWRETRRHSRPDCYSIWLIKRMTRRTSCTTTKNLIKAHRTSSLSQPSTTWEATTKKPHKSIKNSSFNLVNIRLSMCILHCATIRWSTSMFPLKFCLGMKPSILKAFSLQISKHATTIRCTQGRMQRKPCALSNRNSKPEISSKTMTSSNITSLSSEMERMPCNTYLASSNSSLKLDWIWSFTIWRMTQWKKPLT